MFGGDGAVTIDARLARDWRLDIEEFHTQYGWSLDRGAIEAWPEYFTDDAIYRVTARENADSGLPVGLVYAEGKAMIKDRAFAIARTQMFAPRYMQHFTSNVRVIEAGPEHAKACSNYLLLQTLMEGPTTIQQSGRYYDSFVRRDGRLLLRERQCVYDTLIIANDLVYPV
jgi:anthranilate 1,2-dioxygenase small subunit